MITIVDFARLISFWFAIDEYTIAAITVHSKALFGMVQTHATTNSSTAIYSHTKDDHSQCNRKNIRHFLLFAAQVIACHFSVRTQINWMILQFALCSESKMVSRTTSHLEKNYLAPIFYAFVCVLCIFLYTFCAINNHFCCVSMWTI